MSQPANNSGLEAPTLRLVTLGGAELVDTRGAHATLLGPGKPVALLAYLAAAPGRTARREHLIDLLWADMEPEAGRHALRQLIWYVRQRAGDLLESTRDSVRLKDGISSDREELLAALERQDSDHVVELYVGEFLPALALPGGGEFEQWADLERRHLRSAYMRSGDAVTRRLLGAGRAREAVALARRLRDTDPESEPAWRLLLESLLSANDLLAATSEADALVRHFAAESRELEGSTRALVRRATATPQASEASHASHALDTELIGRAEEFRRLLSAWEGARAGRFRHVHVVAPAGLGKSRLLSDFAARLRARGARVVSVRLRPGDRALPQSGAGDIAAALASQPGAAGISSGAARSIVALHPTLSSQYAVEPDASAGEEGLRRRTVALQELVAAVADDAPVCLLVDDVHWMDDASRRMLTSVLQRLDGQRVLVVTASRPRYADVSSPATEQVALHPLTVQQTGALAATLGSLPAEPWTETFVDALHEATSGSPLLLLETLQLLIEQGLLHLYNAMWRSPDPAALDRALDAGSALSARVSRLERAERTAVLLLAIAGLPLESTAIARLTGQSPVDTDRSLTDLEQRGLLTRLAFGWTLAHDAIGEACTDIARPEELRATHLALGEHWAAVAGDDMHALRRGASHLAAAGAATPLEKLFLRWTRVARRSGDRRSVVVLAEELLGREHAALVPALAASSPLHLRFSRRAMASAAAALVIALVAIGLTQTRSAGSAVPPEAVLIAAAVSESGTDTQFVQVPLRRDERERRALVEVGGMAAASGAYPIPHALARLSPDSSHWAIDRLHADSGGFDIALVNARTGTETRFTSSRTDQLSPSWSPDGRYLVYATGQFDTLQHLAVAVAEVASGAVRRLTNSPHTDARPLWHPSGTYIAFTRRYWDRVRPFDFCTITVDGSRESCFPVAGLAGFVILGWYDERRAVVYGGSEPQTFGIVDIATREHRRIGQFTGGGFADLSPDGRWIACECRPLDNPLARARLTVFSVDDPGHWKQLTTGGAEERQLRFVWASRPRTRRHVVSLEVTPGSVTLNARAQLRVVARNGDRREVGGIPLSWRSLTPDIATVDSTGTLTPKAAGVAIVSVSAGGWVTTQARIQVTAPVARLLLEESWKDGFGAFVPFGTPKAQLLDDSALGRAMAPNGDGSFPSGVYTRQQFDATGGLAVEIETSTPITRTQWQSLSVELTPALSQDSLARWDHENGNLPFGPRSVNECWVTIPAGEGPESAGIASVGSQRSHMPAALLTGRTYRVTLQYFPDGSCGLAIDGKVVAWESSALPPGLAVRLAIHGHSFRTRIAVGRVRVYSGVLPGLKWWN